MNKVIRILLGITILTSFITHTLDDESSNFILARMTFSDIFGLLAILIFSFEVLRVNYLEFFKKIPTIYKYGFILLGCLFISVITSLAPKKTLAEVLIHSYLFVLSIVVFYIYKDRLRSELMPLLISVLCITSVIGLYDVIAINLDLPTIFNTAKKTHGISGFRNLGQAANFNFTYLSILIPLKYAGFFNSYSPLKKVLLNSTLLISMLFLFSTGRISIIIAFIIGILFFVVYTRKRIITQHFSVLLVLFIGFLLAIYKWTPQLYTTLVYRIQSRVTNRVANTPEADFIVENFKNSIQAFKDNIFFGTGLGGFVTHYSKDEIHGTYLKILGETGLIGVVGYISFMGYFTYIIFKEAFLEKNKFFSYFIPFYFASLISWSYNYHLRKKEFWLLLAFFMILYTLKTATKSEVKN